MGAARPNSKMAYRVYSKASVGAVGIVVETAKDALVKAAEFAEDGVDVVVKDFAGRVIDLDALAERAANE